jgi:hypothetical protein
MDVRKGRKGRRWKEGVREGKGKETKCGKGGRWERGMAGKKKKKERKKERTRDR